jgi:hypothetical protein
LIYHIPKAVLQGLNIEPESNIEDTPLIERSFKEVEELGGEELEEIQNLYKRRAKKKSLVESERETGPMGHSFGFSMDPSKLKDVTIGGIESMLYTNLNINDMLQELL